jgi:ABC-2 type transport system ATP-binding protein
VTPELSPRSTLAVRDPAAVDADGRPAVTVHGAWKRFGTVDVVQDLSFDVRRGEILGFLGPNGAGKTTTMRMILDIIRPDRGEITVFGGAPGVEHQTRVGYLPEERGLYRDVPVLDTLAYFGALRGMDAGHARRRARQLLEEVGLGGAIRKKAAELSRGMHQKAQVIATVLHEPDLLIVDEPFQGLDPVNARMLRELLVAQRSRGAAVVMSTHDMGDAQTLCDRIVLIDGGRRLLYGGVDEIRRAFGDGAVTVRGSDVPRDPDRYRSVRDVVAGVGGVRFLLRADATPADLFRELAAMGASVELFEVTTPGLDEVFVRAVAGDGRETVR